jgi:predicted nucleotidyltransferase
MENDERIRLVLKKHPQILLAVLFGSLARNAAGVDSDIDLAVSADRPLSAHEKNATHHGFGGDYRTTG